MNTQKVVKNWLETHKYYEDFRQMTELKNSKEKARSILNGDYLERTIYEAFGWGNSPRWSEMHKELIEFVNSFLKEIPEVRNSVMIMDRAEEIVHGSSKEERKYEVVYYIEQHEETNKMNFNISNFYFQRDYTNENTEDMRMVLSIVEDNIAKVINLDVEHSISFTEKRMILTEEFPETGEPVEVSIIVIRTE